MGWRNKKFRLAVLPLKTKRPKYLETHQLPSCPLQLAKVRCKDANQKTMVVRSCDISKVVLLTQLAELQASSNKWQGASQKAQLELRQAQKRVEELTSEMSRLTAQVI